MAIVAWWKTDNFLIWFPYGVRRILELWSRFFNSFTIADFLCSIYTRPFVHLNSQSIFIHLKTPIERASERSNFELLLYDAIRLIHRSGFLASTLVEIALLSFDLNRERSDQLHRWCPYICKFLPKCLEKCTINSLIILLQNCIHVFKITPASRSQCFSNYPRRPIFNSYSSELS